MAIVNPFARSSRPEENSANQSPEVNLGVSNSAPVFKKISKAEEDQNFDEYFSEDDETAALNAAKGKQELKQVISSDHDPIALALNESFRNLKRKYPEGGLKTSRFITSKILMEAPADYFDRFEEDVEKAVNWVQAKLSELKSDDISEAKLNPTDEAIQERAFKAVQNLTIEYMERLFYRGIEKEIVKVLVNNEIVGFGRLDPLWRDRNIDEILANGPFDVQVEIKGKLYRVPSCKFRDKKHMYILLERLYGAINKSLSQSTPLMKGRLHDNSRMFATHHIVAPAGPNFSIRRHPEKFWTANDLVQRGAASAEVMTSIGNLIYKGCSFIVIGGTSTGKTSMLNAMTGFYRDDVRIITLEDNLEMKPNPTKMLAAAMECIQPAIDRPNDRGVTMRDLVKASTQLRPDAVIVGEVTDSAAYDLAQVLNTGHFGASTVHANSEYDGIYRIASLIAQSELVSAEGALPLIAAAFDFIIQLEHFPIDGSRRIVSISEVPAYTTVDANGRQELVPKQLWSFVQDGMVADEENGEKIAGHWEEVGKISELRAKRRHLNLERDRTWEELKELGAIPAHLQPKIEEH